MSENREIKFRVWHPTVKIMLDNPNTDLVAPINSAIKTSQKNGYTWMQFTGLKDKNGKDIYEGDLLDFDENEWGEPFTPEVIKMADITGEWRLAGTKDDLRSFRQVVGNIFETPELLETSDEREQK